LRAETRIFTPDLSDRVAFHLPSRRPLPPSTWSSEHTPATPTKKLTTFSTPSALLPWPWVLHGVHERVKLIRSNSEAYGTSVYAQESVVATGPPAPASARKFAKSAKCVGDGNLHGDLRGRRCQSSPGLEEEARDCWAERPVPPRLRGQLLQVRRHGRRQTVCQGIPGGECAATGVDRQEDTLTDHIRTSLQ
jgi:hypothetical protein